MFKAGHNKSRFGIRHSKGELGDYFVSGVPPQYSSEIYVNFVDHAQQAGYKWPNKRFTVELFDTVADDNPLRSQFTVPPDVWRQIQ